MKETLVASIFLISIAFTVSCLTFLMYNGVKGWGWLVLIGIIQCCISVSIKSNGEKDK